MDLNLISSFVDIAQAGNLSEAARRTGVTRSHVSQRLQLLERHLNVQLVRRTTRRLELTEAGQTVYEHGLRIRGHADAITADVGALSGGAEGSVRLSIPTGFGRLIVAPMLFEFQRRYPRITLSTRFTNRIDDLITAQIDVALKVAQTPPLDYVAREVATLAWVLCATPGYLDRNGAISDPGDLKDHAFVAPPIAARRQTLRMIVAGKPSAVQITPKIQSEDFWFLLDAALAGLGVCLLPTYLAGHALADGRLRRVLPSAEIENPGERLFLISTPSAYPAPARRLLIDFLTNELRRLRDGSPETGLDTSRR